jgi:hypothetical protein
MGSNTMDAIVIMDATVIVKAGKLLSGRIRFPLSMPTLWPTVQPGCASVCTNAMTRVRPY